MFSLTFIITIGTLITALGYVLIRVQTGRENRAQTAQRQRITDGHSADGRALQGSYGPQSGSYRVPGQGAESIDAQQNVTWPTLPPEQTR